jgi:LacI family transcriptional regulator
MRKNITIMDVANDCGLSKSTVAYVLSGSIKGKVSSEKCKIVQRSALKLGYRANLAAKMLSSKKSYTIGVLLPSTKNYYYADMVAVIQHSLNSTNYTPVFAFWENNESKSQVVENILSRQVDAIITCEPKYLPDNLNIPVVSFHTFDKRFDYVGCNPQDIIKTSLEYLLSLGHRRISYIGFTGDARGKEFINLAPEYGVETYEIINLPYDDINAGIEGFAEILSREIKPTAIMTHSDATALGVMRSAWVQNKKIPDDFSLMGYGDIRHSRYSTPSLTSIGQSYDMESYVKMILNVIFNRLKNNSVPVKEYFCEPRLCIRESCKRLNTETIN